jgi:hypothetical protein
MSSLINVCGKQVRVTGRLLRKARLEADAYQFVDNNAEPILNALRQTRPRIDVFTFLHRLPESQPKYPYPMEWDNFAALQVITYDQWWNEQIGFKARNKAKQALKKGVVVREVPFSEALVKGIWAVYNESPMRQGAPNKHYGKDLETVYREEATFLDSSVFIGAFLGDSLIGFIKMVSDETGTQAGLMNIVSMIRHRDLAPTNALVAQAVRSCADRGIRYLVYSKFVYGKKQHSSLTDFKERNGFQKIDVPRYYVPLTRLGELAIRLGLHKKLADRFPEPMLAKLRELRSAWYKRKYQSVAEGS